MSQKETGRSGTIYVVGETDGRYYKIGFTQDKTTGNRLKALQFGNPRKLRVVRVFRDQTEAIEGEIHLRLVNYRAEGEWFEQNSVLDRLIREQISLDEFLSLDPHEFEESKEASFAKMLVKQLYTII